MHDEQPRESLCPEAPTVTAKIFGYPSWTHTSWGPTPAEVEKLTTRVTSALSSQNTVTALMGTSLLEKATEWNSGAGTVGGAEGEEEAAMLTQQREIQPCSSVCCTYVRVDAFVHGPSILLLVDRRCGWILCRATTEPPRCSAVLLSCSDPAYSSSRATSEQTRRDCLKKVALHCSAFLIYCSAFIFIFAISHSFSVFITR